MNKTKPPNHIIIKFINKHFRSQLQLIAANDNIEYRYKNNNKFSLSIVYNPNISIVVVALKIDLHVISQQTYIINNHNELYNVIKETIFEMLEIIKKVENEINYFVENDVYIKKGNAVTANVLEYVNKYLKNNNIKIIDQDDVEKDIYFKCNGRNYIIDLSYLNGRPTLAIIPSMDNPIDLYVKFILSNKFSCKDLKKKIKKLLCILKLL